MKISDRVFVYNSLLRCLEQKGMERREGIEEGRGRGKGVGLERGHCVYYTNRLIV